jgi:hypothetical protein
VLWYAPPHVRSTRRTPVLRSRRGDVPLDTATSARDHGRQRRQVAPRSPQRCPAVTLPSQHWGVIGKAN